MEIVEKAQNLTTSCAVVQSRTAYTADVLTPLEEPSDPANYTEPKEIYIYTKPVYSVSLGGRSSRAEPSGTTTAVARLEA